MTASALRRVRVAEIESIADGIKRFRLVDAAGDPLAAFSAGSHVVVTIGDGNGHMWKNPYSLTSTPGDTSAYEIGVLRTLTSRGGSVFMHERVAPGSELQISEPVNLFPVVRLGRKHIFIAGGIGITPFIAMMQELAAGGADFELHYTMRSASRGAFCEKLLQTYGSRVHLYHDDRGEGLTLSRLLGEQPLGTHMYVCGPAGMIDWALGAGRAAGWPEENLHCERFTAPLPATPSPSSSPARVATSSSARSRASSRRSRRTGSTRRTCAAAAPAGNARRASSPAAAPCTTTTTT